jgi:hypothetical protein
LTLAQGVTAIQAIQLADTENTVWKAAKFNEMLEKRAVEIALPYRSRLSDRH